MPSEASYKKIEGEWKDFRFRRIQPEDRAAVYDHIGQNYCKDEAVSSLLGWSQGYADDVNRIVEPILEDGMSFLCEHIPTGKIAGVRITADHNPQTATRLDKVALHTRGAQLFFKFYGDIVGMADVTSKKGIDRWAEFVIASTNRDFRNQGIAGEFYNRSIEFLRAEGHKHALVIVTSPWTKRATANRDFEQLTRLNYENFMDYDGKPVFDKSILQPDHHFALVNIRTL
jgi:GNAT superfamily N-acetyltransferase